MFAEQYPDRDYDDLKDMVQIGWLRKAHKEIVSALATAPVAETAGEIGRNITFSPLDLETGNAVVSPQEPDGPYWTLIAQGGEAEQNKIAAEIVRRLNAPVPAQDDDKLRIAVEAWDELAKRPGLEISFNGFGEEDGWVVHRVTGGVNDREWEELACADTPLEALQEALAALESTAAQEGGGS